MVEEKAYEIIAPPKNYSEWLRCFEVLERKTPTAQELAYLRSGVCTDSAGSVGFLETQLIKTVNAMIKKYIKDFNREYELCVMYNEYDNLYQLFRELSRKTGNCMFFTQLDFMSEGFRNELHDSIVREFLVFWNSVLGSIQDYCVDQNNSVLIDELYMIRRIKLFR